MCSSRPAPPLSLPVVLACAALAFGGATARAADFVTADTLGSGGAVAGDPRATGSLLAAPALQALEPRYDVIGGVRLGGTDDWLIQVEARDSRTGPVALSLAWTRRMASPPPADADLPGWRLEDEALENPLTENSVVLGAASALLDGRLGLGLSGVRYGRDTAYTDPSAIWEAGIGVSGRPIEPLYLSLGAHHLLDLLRDGEAEHPLTSTAGLGLRSDLASLFGQVELELHDPATSLPLGWRVGGELALAEGTLPLRLGFRQDIGLETTFLCAGIGATTPQASLDYALVRDIGPDGGASDVTGARTWHSLSIKLMLPDPQ